MDFRLALKEYTSKTRLFSLSPTLLILSSLLWCMIRLLVHQNKWEAISPPLLGKAGWGSEHSGIVEVVPAHSTGERNRWSLRALPTQAILWIYDSMCTELPIFQPLSTKLSLPVLLTVLLVMMERHQKLTGLVWKGWIFIYQGFDFFKWEKVH